MSELNEQERLATLSEWAESDAPLEGMKDATIVRGEGDTPGRALLAAALGSEEAVDRAIGRPSLNRRRPAGESPVRHIRLSAELDAALTARASAEHRNASEVMREALAAYLQSA